MPVQQSQAGLSAILRRGSVALGVSVVAKALWAVLLVVQMLLLGRLVDALVFQGSSISHELNQMAWLAIAFIARSGLQFVADMAGEYAGVKSITALRQELFTHLQRVGPIGLAEQPAGALAMALTDGVNALQPFIAQYIPRAVSMLVLPMIIVAVVAKLDVWSFVILAVTGPLIPLFMVLVGYRAQSVMNSQWEQMLRLGASFLDYLQGLTTLRLFGRARDSIAVVMQAADLHRQATMRVMRVAFLTSAALEFFSTLAIALVTITVGARLLSGSMEFSVAFVVLLLVPEFFAPLREFSASYHAKQNAKGAMEKLSALMALPALREAYVPAPVAREALAAVHCQAIAVGYPGRPAVLRQLSCVFRAGAVNVITGASGAGKTTLARVLSGLVPVAGGRLWGEDSQGHFVARQHWRSALVTQAPQLIEGSIADNLRLSAPGASQEQLYSAINAADSMAFIQRFPEGLDTWVGASGTALSSGEIRRIALIRALLTNPELLILDEPTANLDPHSAAALVGVIKTLAKQLVLVAVSHRLDVIGQADQVFSIHQGQIRVDLGEAAA